MGSVASGGESFTTLSISTFHNGQGRCIGYSPSTPSGVSWHVKYTGDCVGLFVGALEGSGGITPPHNSIIFSSVLAIAYEPKSIESTVQDNVRQSVIRDSATGSRLSGIVTHCPRRERRRCHRPGPSSRFPVRQTAINTRRGYHSIILSQSGSF